jgi:hypothetical protein
MSNNLDKYRSSSEYKEILRILQKTAALQENILWQTQGQSKTIVPAHYIEIDFVGREVVMTYDANQFKLSENLPLYVRLDYRTSVFKVDNFRQSQNTVMFPIPELMKTLELRSTPRSFFQPHQEKFVSLKSSLHPSSPYLKDSGSEIHVRVMDISQYGLGLVISDLNRNFLKNNRILWITSLQGILLNYPMLGEVVYINNEVDSKFQNKKQKTYKVGIKFSGPFPEEAFHRFIT